MAGRFTFRSPSHGDVQQLFPSDPGVATPLTVNVPDDEVWQLTALYALVTTDIAAASREVHLSHETGGGVIIWRVVLGTLIPNSVNRHVCFGRAFTAQASTQGSITIQGRPPVTGWVGDRGNSERIRLNLVPFGGDDQITAAALTYARWRE